MTGLANRILHAFSLVVTDRRWAVPLSASALGFGLFVGVAIGPSAAGTLAGTAQILEVPSSSGGGSDTEVEAGGAPGGLSESLAGGGEGGALETSPALAPIAPEPIAAAPAEEEPAPEPAPPASEEASEEDEEETELTGIVVHANPAAGGYALAIEGGELVPVHARKLPPAGAKLTVIATRLANGTFAESEPPRRSGKASQVSFRGVVTYVDSTPTAPAYTVSGRGASLLVHVDPDPSGAPQLPALGARVTVTAAIEKPQPLAPETAPPTAEAPVPPPTCARDPSQPLPKVEAKAVLRQRQVEVEAGDPSTYLDLSGIVTAVCPETAQLLLSADGLDESAHDLTLAVPAEIDTAKLKQGDSLLATATLEPEGTLTLAGLASDEHIKGADNAALAQGDLKR